MLEKIKAILDIKDTSKDYLLEIYLQAAMGEFELLTTYLPQYEHLIIQMVVEKYNKRFYEGMAATSTDGISTTLKDGYSKVLQQQLNQLKKKVRLY